MCLSTRFVLSELYFVSLRLVMSRSDVAGVAYEVFCGKTWDGKCDSTGFVAGSGRTGLSSEFLGTDTHGGGVTGFEVPLTKVDLLLVERLGTLSGKAFAIRIS